MNKITLTLLSLLISFLNFSQTVTYEGTIGKHAAQINLIKNSKNEVRAVYLFEKHNTPTSIGGALNKDTLILNSKNTQISFLFEHFSFDSTHISGIWKNKKKNLPISMTKTGILDDYMEQTSDSIELIQIKSTERHYFKLLLNEYLEPKKVLVYDKKKNKIIQEISLPEMQYLEFNNVSVGDYNFDGTLDFSIFEGSYSGGTIVSLYFLADSSGKTYFEDEYFGGSNLYFDYDRKLIYHRSSCCAGKERYTSTYRVEKNKMILISSICLKLDDDTNDYIEVDCD